MRLFVASVLPEEIREELARSAAQADVRAAFVPPRNYHITLVFIGEQPGSALPAVARAVRAGLGDMSAPQLSLSCPGSFGREDAAVLWYGVAGAESLKMAAVSIGRELEAAGIGFDKKPFKAHITMARRAQRVMLPEVKPLRWRVDEVALMCSELGKGSPIYTPVETFRLR